MTMRIHMVVVLLAMLAGCIQDAWNDWQSLGTAEPASTTAAGSTSTGLPAPPTTGDGIQTVTSATTSPEPGETTAPTTTTPSTTMAPEENAPPVIESFGLSPDLLTKPSVMLHLGEAGAALLHIAVSEDTTTVRLTHKGEPFAELEPQEFPYTYEVLSAKFNGLHKFEAVAVDAEGLESTPAVAMLSVEAPPSGVEKCLFDKDRDDAAVDSSSIAGLVYADDAIVAVGMRNAGAGPRLAAWKLDRDHCELLPGWPKSGFGQLGNKMSKGTAVTVDHEGNLYVAGVVFDPVVPQRYVAKLNPGGSLLWDDLGEVGEVIEGMAAAPPPQATLYAVGWRQTSPDPEPTDARIWIYKPDGGKATPFNLKAPLAPGEQPDAENKWSERLRAVVFGPTAALAFAVGEREFKGADAIPYTRTFWVRIHPLTGPMDSWTSPGEFVAHDAALGLGLCGERLIAAGWRRDDVPGDQRAALLQWFTTNGTLTAFRPLPLSPAELRAVACDRELKVVGAGVLDLGSRDAKVFATPGTEGPLEWYESGSADADEAVAVSCDRRGFCAWGGFRTSGKQHAVVRVHHP